MPARSRTRCARQAYGAIDNLYTATVYEKGAELIRMLKTLIGDEAFFKGMSLYFDRHDGEAVHDRRLSTPVSKRPAARILTIFMRWYGQPGTPHSLSSQRH